MNRVLRHFSVINKLRTSTRLRQGNNYPRSPTHSFQDQPTPLKTLSQKTSQLSPNQLYLIQNKAMQRPFTGKLWAQVATGHYHCSVCDTRLFTFNHKYKANTGYASFWRAIQDRVKAVQGQVVFDQVNQMKSKYKSHINNYKRAECSSCGSHLGAVFFDGPPPTFLRYSINSAALKYKDMEAFPDPNIARKKKKGMKVKKAQLLR